jgi:hypothetical protein
VRGNTNYHDGGVAFDIVGYNAEYGRGVIDVSLIGNVAVNNDSRGNFLLVEAASQQITLIDNVYVAPYLSAGAWGAAAVFVNDADLSSFSRIDGNTWPSTARGTAYANGGIVFVDRSYTSSGHKAPTTWNALPQVGDDRLKTSSSMACRTRSGPRRRPPPWMCCRSRSSRAYARPPVPGELAGLTRAPLFTLA